MDDIREFTVPGPVVGKQRPKFSTRGKYAIAYTPKETANYESLVRLSYMQAYSDRKPFEKDVQLAMKIMVYCKIPKATSKKKIAEMLGHIVRPTKKPDLDNVAKGIWDALNSVAYYDDSQIVSLTVRKYYSDEPKACVTLYAISDQDSV